MQYDLKQQCFTNEEYLAQFPPYLYRYMSLHCAYHLVERYTEVFDFVTLLRSPAERLYSEYNYLKLLYAYRRRCKTADTIFLDKKFGYEFRLKLNKKEAWQLNGFSSKADCIHYISQSDACTIDNQIYAEAVHRYSKNKTLSTLAEKLRITSQ